MSTDLYSSLPSQSVTLTADPITVDSTIHDIINPHVNLNFMYKLFSMLSDPQNSAIIRWRPDGVSFEIVDICALEEQVLPRYFVNTRFASLTRQFNFYNIRKCPNQKTCVYKHESLQKGKPELLPHVERKTHTGVIVRCSTRPVPIDLLNVLHEYVNPFYGKTRRFKSQTCEVNAPRATVRGKRGSCDTSSMPRKKTNYSSGNWSDLGVDAFTNECISVINHNANFFISFHGDFVGLDYMVRTMYEIMQEKLYDPWILLDILNIYTNESHSMYFMCKPSTTDGTVAAYANMLFIDILYLSYPKLYREVLNYATNVNSSTLVWNPDTMISDVTDSFNNLTVIFLKNLHSYSLVILQSLHLLLISHDPEMGPSRFLTSLIAFLTHLSTF